MFGRKRPPPVSAPEVLLHFGGGHGITIKDIYAHVLVMGASNAGKSYSTEPLLMGAHRLGCPILATGVKPDEAARYQRITNGIRFLRVGPGTGHGIRLLDYVRKSYGSDEAVADFLRRINEAQLKTGSNSNQEAYWTSLFDQASLNAVRLVWLGLGEVSLECVYRVLSTAPRTKEDAKLPELFERSVFGMVLKQAVANRTDANEHDLQRVIDFFTEYSQLGDKAQGAVLSMVNGSIGRLLSGPFYQAFNAETTTLSPEIIEQDRLTVLLDYPVLHYGPPARLFQLAWTMLMQGYCLRRDASTRNVPTLLVRDECQFSLSPEWDMQVQTVARSQKLSHISLIQDIDTLVASLGGDARAETEAHAWISNHQVKLLFGTSNSRSGEFIEKLIGEHREMFATVSSGGGAQENYIDSLLGVGKFSFSASQQMRPYVTPSDLASLPQGCCIVHQAGRMFNGRPYMIANLRRD